MKPALLRKKLDAALGELAEAETSLEGLLRELRIRPRAEKVTVTSVVEAAFSRLRSARTELDAIQKLVSADAPPAAARRPSTARRKA